jgi:triacylglycerol esterase/lipase EstA (alpha/beta hydrolase family)
VVRGWRGAAVAGTALAIALVAGAGTAVADQAGYAPLDRPGPPLTVSQTALRASLTCTPGVAGARRNPILLVPGSNLDPGPNYSWNYERALRTLGWPYCTVTLPFHTLGDIQVAGEYVVNALRTMGAASGRRVDVLGYSQGGMLPRWALRFWPDTRPLVGDLVALDPSNHGTLDADAVCQGSCPPADWQQASRARFEEALNSGTETFAGIDYTVVYSHTDEIVVPNVSADGSSSLHTGAGHIANIAVQDICPNDASEHLAMGSYDPVGYALALDAFTHPGTADAARIDRAVCAQPFQPGVNPATFASDYAGYAAAIGQAQQQAPTVDAEPPLRCYVYAACRTAASDTQSAPRPRHAIRRRRSHHHRTTKARAGRVHAGLHSYG